MLLTQISPSEFDRLLRAAEVFRARFQGTPPSGEGIVLVDLMHNHATVLILNLITALYAAEWYGCRVAGVTTRTFVGHPVPVDMVTRLAAAFGAPTLSILDDESLVPNDLGETMRAEAGLIEGDWAGRHGHDLRRAVLDAELAGCRVGDLVYDSYLYQTVAATIESCSDPLVAVLRRAATMTANTQALLRGHNVKCVMLSHTVYTDYGIPARLALRAGIEVYGRAGGVDLMGMRRYQSLDEAHLSQNVVEPFELDFFRSHLGDLFTEMAEKFFPPHPSKNNGADYYRYGYGPEKREEKKEAVFNFLGIAEDKPTAAIMAHHFTDACHCYPDLLFEDYYVWLDNTLRIAAETQSVNWLLRQHPYEIMVGHGKNFQHLADKYKNSGNIFIVPNEITTSSLFDCVDVVITATGTAGLEFASVGIPCILAGRPFYADLGFDLRPASQEAYEDALRAIPTMPRLSQDAVRTAKEAAFVHYNCMRVISTFVPRSHDVTGRAVTHEEVSAYWEDIARRLEERAIGDDLFYRSLRTLFAQKRPIMLNQDAAHRDYWASHPI